MGQSLFFNFFFSHWRVATGFLILISDCLRHKTQCYVSSIGNLLGFECSIIRDYNPYLIYIFKRGITSIITLGTIMATLERLK